MKKLVLVWLFLNLFVGNAFALNKVQLNPVYVPDVTRSRAIANGYVYVGVPDLDPEVVANQKQISVQQEDGTVVNVAQPLRTNAGGVPEYNGSPVTILVDGDYSLKILDSLSSQVFYVPSDVTITTLPTKSLNTNYACDLAAAVTDIGATPTTIEIDCSYDSTGDNVTVPTTLESYFVDEGFITGTGTINWNGYIDGGQKQFFDTGVTISLVNNINDSINTIWFPTIAGAVTAIGGNEQKLIINNNQTISADLTIPSNIYTLVLPGYAITIADTFTVTINGNLKVEASDTLTFNATAGGGAETLNINGALEVGIYPLFDTGLVVNGLDGSVYPEWWAAFPDNTTDYSTELQASLNNMEAGAIWTLSPGVYLTSTHLVYKPNRSYEGTIVAGSTCAIKQADSSNIADGIFVSEGYNSSSTSPDDPVSFKNFTILGNKANNAGAATVGILATNYDSLIENMLVFQTKGDGIRFDDTSLTSGAVGNAIINTVVRQADGDGISIGASRFTDGIISNTEVGSAGEYCIYVDGAGWEITGNNAYDCGFNGIFVGVGWNTIISNNIVDGWGQSSTTSDYRGIWLNGLFDSLSNTITGNSLTMKAADIVAVTNYIGIHINPQAAETTSQCALTGNSIIIDSAATTSEGIRVGGSGAGGQATIVGNITQFIDATKEIVNFGTTNFEIIHSENSFDKIFQNLAGSGTPSVLYGSNFKTSSTNITYTNFTNGYNGQKITVIFAFAPGTGFVDFTGTNLKGNGGVDWTFTLGDHMTCVHDGTDWYCDISDNTA